MTESINDKGVCRTVPAIQSLLKRIYIPERRPKIGGVSRPSGENQKNKKCVITSKNIDKCKVPFDKSP